jgi:hypothetical protein
MRGEKSHDERPARQPVAQQLHANLANNGEVGCRVEAPSEAFVVEDEPAELFTIQVSCSRWAVTRLRISPFHDGLVTMPHLKSECLQLQSAIICIMSCHIMSLHIAQRTSVPFLPRTLSPSAPPEPSHVSVPFLSSCHEALVSPLFPTSGMLVIVFTTFAFFFLFCPTVGHHALPCPIPTFPPPWDVYAQLPDPWLPAVPPQPQPSPDSHQDAAPRRTRAFLPAGLPCGGVLPAG